MIAIHCRDVLDWALEYKRRIEVGEAKPISCWLTDPPYGLGDPPPMDELLGAWLAGESYDTGSGFMSACWDVVPGPHIWRAFLEISYPGAWLFAFGGTRTVDLLCLSLRIAGWVKRDEITHWIYGSGFPKSHNISKAIDASEGAKRPKTKDARPKGGKPIGAWRHEHGISHWQGEAYHSGGREFFTTDDNPITHFAKLFDGYGTALKPAVEPVVVFQAPRQGHTFAELARLYGTGGLCVEAGRVSCDDKAKFPAGVISNTEKIFGGGIGLHGDKPRGADSNPSGRFPPNAAFSHNAPRICPTCQGQGVISSEALRREYGVELPDEVTCPGCGGERLVGGCRRVGRKRVRGLNRTGKYIRPKGKAQGWKLSDGGNYGYQDHTDADGCEEVDDWDCVEGCAVQLLGEMSGERKSGAIKGKRAPTGQRGIYGGFPGNEANVDSSTGTATRYYHNFSWELDALEPLELSPFFYAAKSSTGERQAGVGRNPHPT